MTTLCFFASFWKTSVLGPGNFFGELEVLVVFTLAKILRAEKFLCADDVRAGLGGVLDERNGFLEVRVGIGRHVRLDEAEFDFGRSTAFHEIRYWILSTAPFLQARWS